MSKLFDAIRYEHSKVEEITVQFFNKQKSELSEDEFNRRFYKEETKRKRGVYKYYKYMLPFEDTDITPLLLYKLLLEQEQATKKLRNISSIMSLAFIIGIILVIVNFVIA